MGDKGIAATAAVVAASRPSPTGRVVKIAALLGGLFVLALLQFVLIFLRYAISTPVGLMLSAIAAFIPALFYSCLVILLDRNEREPMPVLLGTFLWGALVATLIAFVFNTIFGAVALVAMGKAAAQVLTASISAPFVEETSKGLAVLLLFLFLRQEFDDVLDGIVYGSLIGFGFAMTENVLYFVRAYSQAAVVGLVLLVYIRVILGGFAHAAYTATTGAGFGYARETTSPAMTIIAPVLGWCLAMFEHFSWNFFAVFLIPHVVGRVSAAVQLLVMLPLLGIIFTAPIVITLLVLVFVAWRREARIIHEQLREEVQLGVVSLEEYDRLSSERRRLQAEWQALKTGGVPAWHAMSQLHQTAASLAFRKWHLSRGEEPKRDQKDATEEEYRQQLVALRTRLHSRYPVALAFA